MEESNLFYSIMEGDIDWFMKLINQGEDVFYLDRKNRSLLINAIIENENEIAKILIDKEIHLSKPDEKGLTPLHLCAMLSNIEIAKTLYAKKVEIDIKDHFGNTPLWRAVFECKGKKYEIVKLLKSFGADEKVKNNYDTSPKDFAMRIGDEKLLNILSS